EGVPGGGAVGTGGPGEAGEAARRAQRPGWEERAARTGKATARRCRTAGAEGDGSAAPRPKTAAVERREASVPRHGTQGASQAPGVPRHKRVHARLVTRRGHASRVFRRAPERFSALRPPSFRVSEATMQTRGGEGARGGRDGLFEIVRWNNGEGFSDEPQFRHALIRPHPEERACGRSAASSNAACAHLEG